MQVAGLLFYLFGALDFLLWFILDINLTHTAWSPLAAGLLGRACIAFGAVNATALRRASEPDADVAAILAKDAEPQAQTASDFIVVESVTSAV